MWAKPWEIRRSAEADAERRDVDQIRRHLGTQDRLARLGDPAASALALRVHPTIEAKAGDAAPRPRRGWRRATRRPIDPDRGLPTFVDRDVGEKVRDWMRKAAEGRLLLLVGDSSVGKTRLLYEAAHKFLPGFSVLVESPWV